MEKIKMGAKTFLYPMPVTLVGANVNGKPNFLTIAWCGIIQRDPAVIALSLGRSHYSTKGIFENKTFSVNIPSEDLVNAVDYCGLVSGKNVDKSHVFEVFYGTLKTAPMVKECPVNMECELMQTIDLSDSLTVFLGKIVETYSEEKYLTADLPDMEKIQPMVYSPYDKHYWKIGEQLAPAYQTGKNYK